jgi:ATP-dependent DNA ligase
MKIKSLPTGFIIPAQPVLASTPPSGAGWVHEIKHDGYRMIVRRDGAAVRIYSRNGNDWTARLAGIAAVAGQIEARSFTVDGEAVVLGPDGLSRFEELSRRDAADTAILYAFDLIERDGEDMRDLPFLERNGVARHELPPAPRLSEMRSVAIFDPQRYVRRLIGHSVTAKLSCVLQGSLPCMID